MKRYLAFVFLFFTVISVFGCASDTQGAYTAQYNGVIFNVNPALGTITDGRYTYSYEFSGTAEKGNAKITYPDGSTYSFTKDGIAGYGGWSEDYSDEVYTDGSILCELLFDNAEADTVKISALSIIVLVVFGFVMAAYPRKVWQLEYGWRFKNAEPSDAALAANRIVGLILIFTAIILIFIKLGL